MSQHASRSPSSTLGDFLAAGVVAEDVPSLFPLLSARPLLAAFVALFRGGDDEVLIRLSVLKGIGTRAESPFWSPRELEEQFVRASGPGGQNVNKVSTAVELRFDVINSQALASDLKGRLIQIAGKRVNADGVLILEAKRFRTQEANREDALAKFHELIRKAGEKPKARHKTKPTKASKEERLKEKKQRGKIKKLRRERAVNE